MWTGGGKTGGREGGRDDGDAVKVREEEEEQAEEVRGGQREDVQER